MTSAIAAAPQRKNTCSLRDGTQEPTGRRSQPAAFSRVRQRSRLFPVGAGFWWWVLGGGGIFWGVASQVIAAATDAARLLTRLSFCPFILKSEY